MEKLLSIHETSELLGLSVSTIYKYVCCRKIPHLKLGNRLLFRIEKLETWISENSVEPVGTVVLRKASKKSGLSKADEIEK
ncbi:MAG: helix-turn-helix domain-containing protein [Candidatus Sifarchaeia archaeon]|jgi:excisionase family DNA binding protein